MGSSTTRNRLSRVQKGGKGTKVSVVRRGGEREPVQGGGKVPSVEKRERPVWGKVEQGKGRTTSGWGLSRGSRNY